MGGRDGAAGGHAGMRARGRAGTAVPPQAARLFFSTRSTRLASSFRFSSGTFSTGTRPACLTPSPMVRIVGWQTRKPGPALI